MADRHDSSAAELTDVSPFDVFALQRGSTEANYVKQSELHTEQKSKYFLLCEYRCCRDHKFIETDKTNEMDETRCPIDSQLSLAVEG